MRDERKQKKKTGKRMKNEKTTVLKTGEWKEEGKK